MSAHPHERLSAFLDNELAPQERAQIEQHLRTCAECAQELSELALVDRLGRELDVDVPEGYLEGLPARLRPRLRAARPARRRIVPMWALAAAALVLVGLLVPITWQRRGSELSAPMPESRAAAPAQQPQAERALVPAPTTAPGLAPPQAAPLAAPALRGSVPADRPQALDRVQGDFAPPPRTTQPTSRPAADEHSKADYDRLKALGYTENADRDGREEPTTARADAMRARQFGPSAGGAAPAPAPGRAPASAPPVAPPPAAPPAATGAAVAKSAAPPPPAAPEPAVEAHTATGTLELDEESARAKHERRAAESFRLTDSDKRRDTEPKVDQAVANKSFSELASRSMLSAADARRLRRAWREFADLHPSDPHADEARMRAVHAAAFAYHMSGDPMDKQTLVDDVQDYLKRNDAKLKDAVRALSVP